MGGGGVHTLVPPPRCPLHRPPRRLSRHSELHTPTPTSFTLCSRSRRHTSHPCVPITCGHSQAHTRRPRVPLDMLALAGPAAARVSLPRATSRSPHWLRGQGLTQRQRKEAEPQRTARLPTPLRPPGPGLPTCLGCAQAFRSATSKSCVKGVKNSLYEEKATWTYGV